MLTRWIPVHRAANASADTAALAGTDSDLVVATGPPERNFPVPVVVAHGVFAVATFALVTLTVLGVGQS